MTVLFIALTPAYAQDLTAEEMLQQGMAAYEQRDWASAEKLFNQFMSSFGESPEAAKAIEHLLPRLALAQVRLKKFDAARETIPRALEFRTTMAPPLVEELLFWNGIAALQAQQLDTAREILVQFAKEFPRSPKRSEALVLAGTTLALQQKFKECAEFFDKVSAELPPNDRARAVVMQLYALIEAEQLDTALRLIVMEYPRLEHMAQLVSFQMLALETGARFLEKEEYLKAIACFQRVWRQERILTHQEQRLAQMKQNLENWQAQPQQAHLVPQLTQMISRVEQEMEQLRKMETFDSALRLRHASAFQAMGRYREAALIMEDMLFEMPPDEVVEQAAVNLVRCWMEIDRWPKVVESADQFFKIFPKSKQVPLILFMKGQSQQNALEYKESIKTFDTIVEAHPKSEFAARAFFMRGFGELLLEDNEAAIKTFEAFPSKYPEHEMVETALYWRGMAYSLAGQHEEARAMMAEYLEKYPKGRHAGDATFRRAFSAHSMRDFETSIREMQAYLKAWPRHASRDEALLLLGDALMSEGFIDEGIAAYQKISPQNVRFFEEGWFKIGRALRLQEEIEKLRAHMLEFGERLPRSPRIAEAIYWIGWTWRQQDEPGKAVEIYWDAIAKYGSDPTSAGVEDLFLALPRLYSGDEGRLQLLARLRDLHEEAVKKEQRALAVRALWAQAQVVRRAEPERAREMLVQAAEHTNVQEDNPLLLADIADALREAGKLEQAEGLYTELVRWNPRAPQKDRAFAGRGLVALEQGREREALEYFERFERETIGSVLLGQVLLAQAKLQVERGQFDAAKGSLERLLASEIAKTQEKVQALFELGEMHMQQKQPSLAIPYYQRIYVMYSRWAEFVAKAYLRSGEAFEELDQTESAIRTYNELLEREELAEFPEFAAARERLARLEGSS